MKNKEYSLPETPTTKTSPAKPRYKKDLVNIDNWEVYSVNLLGPARSQGENEPRKNNNKKLVEKDTHQEIETKKDEDKPRPIEYQPVNRDNELGYCHQTGIRIQEYVDIETHLKPAIIKMDLE
ncbi:hypothetical protein F8M41_025187 [Gigaspora margarita]|uniref:Uncharacterized protein n=1 Tax=Gigaspora margarita TaxID=4874 RepID=A0A8H4B026_GIGMA|nr:hypothetical protein F8M41_025187 [Gigaspora margarita]